MADDLYQYFRIEAREILERLGAGILELESGATPADVVGRLLRDAHTLKGAARVVRQPAIADAAHAVEEALSGYRTPGAPVPRAEIGRLLTLLDEMNAGVSALDTPEVGLATAVEARAAAPEPARAPEVVAAPRAEPQDLGELLDVVAEVATELAAARRGAMALDGLRHTVSLLMAQLTGEGRALPRAIATELRGALVSADRQVNGALERADRELRHVRAVAERLRLTRADTIFTALRRAVRDASEAQGKEVTLRCSGGEVRLDPRVLTTVHSALLHVVRNAVAHGIEKPSDRVARGKPVRGEVVLDVVRRGTMVSFACRDDGRGFDLDAVRRKAQGRVPDDADTATLVAALLRGGISTSESVTEVSGRGIGLDVLRDVAQQLGGAVDVRTEPGAGATVELVVPLSMVAVDGFVVESRGRLLAIPMDCVRRGMRVEAAQVVQAPEGERVLLEEGMVPFLPVERALGTSAAGAPVDACSALVVEGKGGAAVVGVDRLVGTARIVLRPLPELVPAVPVVAGAALDPDGSPRLVLDPDGLVALAHQVGPPAEVPRAASAPILVVDDSVTTRMLERSILESAGYTVDTATCGEEALVQAGKVRYGLFLVDVEMPGMDGYAVVTTIRGDPELRDIPAILLTSRDAPEDRRRGEEAGAQVYLIKQEFDQDVLLGHIRRLMGRP